MRYSLFWSQQHKNFFYKTTDQKGQKIGKLLLEAFENETLNYSSGISLTTDKYNNDYVNNFYVSNNYILNNEFSQGNREMNFYIKKFK